MVDSEGWHGSGTILVVDDEETVRTLTQRALERSGFKVLTAADGRHGLDLYDQNKDAVDAILLDMTMPGLGGEETLSEVRKRTPDLPVILSSGFSEPEPTGSVLDRQHVWFLQKPYLPSTLLKLLRNILDTS